MGVSNPNARARPISTMQSSATTNRETVGGNTKAGIPSRVWHVGQFINGPSGGALIRAPQYSGPFWPYAFDFGKVPTPYPLSLTNVLAGGVRSSLIGGQFGPNSDGLYGGPKPGGKPGFLQLFRYPIIRGQNRRWANRPVRGYAGKFNVFPNAEGIVNTYTGLPIPSPGGFNGMLAPGKGFPPGGPYFPFPQPTFTPMPPSGIPRFAPIGTSQTGN